MAEERGATKLVAGEEARARLAAIVDSSDDAIISKSLEGLVTSWNRGAERLYGYPAEEAVGREISFIIPDDRLDEWQRITTRVKRGERVEHLETARIAKDGRRIDVSLTLSPVHGADGGITGVSTIARDITERKRMERSLRESEKRYRTLVEMAPDAVVVHQEGRFVYANCAALGIFGAFSLELLQRHALIDLVHPDERESVLARMRQLLEGEEIPLREYRLLRLNGEEVSVETSSILIDYQGRASIQIIARDITERKRAERERETMLKELDYERSRFETVVRQMPLGVMIAEAPSGRLIYDNEQSRSIFRQQFQAVASIADYGQWKFRRIDGSPLPIEQYPLARAVRGETVIGEELQIERGDGSRGFVSVNAIPIRDASGEPASGLAAFSDITKSRASAEALRRSEQRFRLMTDSMPQIVWTAEADGSIDYINAHFEAYTGMERMAPEIRDNMTRPERLIFAVVHPDDAPQTAAIYRQAMESGEIYQAETRIRRVDGAYRWHLCRAIPERDEQGEIVRWYGTATDVHDIRDMQEKLRASETKFRRLYESNLVAIFFWNKDGRITEANQAYCDLVGYSVEECRSAELSWRDVTPPELIDRDAAAIEEVRERGICRPYQKVFINRKDGHRVSVLTAVAMMAGSGAAEGAEGIAFAVDLTELKRAEQALKNSEETLKLAIETTGVGIFDLDLRSGKGNWSEIAKRHYGLPPEAEADLALLMAGIHPEDRERVEQIARDAASPEGAGSYSAEYRTIGIGDGRLRWLTMRARNFFDGEGVPARLVGACIDITEIVRAEKALKDEITERLRAVEALAKQEQLLIRQGRLAAMGEMIGNIAHQWRQPLNTLGLIIQELPRYYERNLFTKDYLDASVTRSMQVINYMSKTIDGFRNFFGPDREKEEFRAAEVLDRTVSIVEAAFNELNLSIEVSADREIMLYGCPNEFSQVILNILVNAKDAIMERNVEEPRVALRLFRENDRMVLTIADNAGGIPPEIIDRIFDPYFTTKAPDKGTGIGLFMSKTIIEKNMKGTLTVHNTEQGAQFRIEV
ncbi:MAG: hypothetical protein A2075_13960 [Geobacteraceae bacterium GWC2_58_44]|nr:MAG: hypothetical protein A2075_13960 [Geobacteraceae bacterium GWC2_58_44]